MEDRLEKYNALRDFMSTGDLLLFSGKGGISDLIKEVTTSLYSHCGIALWGFQPGDPVPEKRLFIAESTMINPVPDSMDGCYRKGVQMILLSQKLEGYNGQAWWLRLKQPLTDQEKLFASDFLFKRWTSKTPYDKKQAMQAGLDYHKIPKLFRWMFRPFKSIIENKEDMRALFCSELAAKTLKEAGRLPEDFNASECTPEDLSRLSIFEYPPIPLL